jgi:hypothetical protein
VRLSHDQQGKQHRAGVSVAGRAVALRSSLDGHLGAVAETSEPEPAAGRALKGPDGVGLWRCSLLGAVRVLMRLGLVRVEGVR